MGLDEVENGQWGIYSHILLRHKGKKVYRSVAKPAMLCGHWPAKIQERRQYVAEMRILRWMCRIKKNDRVKNKYSREVWEKLQYRTN